ncbi:glycosyltransferase family 4 protein [Pseudomonas yangonensis]|uniref:glycosyltransferase family 4 protein n=1 Tax=Pseudomonas yangonensis TaxID=2579922 RepID=UPI00137A9457|nr:glycosyltransferase family 1 protein [Pseudomonas yangonensis]
MKLLLNTESLKPPITGIGTYTLNLLQAFARDAALEVECFSGSRFQTPQQALLAATAPIPATGSHSGGMVGRLLRNSMLAYRAREVLRNGLLQLNARRLGGHVYHEPNFILKRHRGPCVATIHDLSFIRYPQHHPAKRVAWLSSQLPATLARADALITDSEYVRRELLEHYRVAPEKVRTIHLGAASHYQPRSAEATRETLQRLGLEHGRYLLFVGTLEPRKGVDTLLDAWQALPGEVQREYPLVLAGASGWKNIELHRQIERLVAKNGLRHLNFVPAAELPLLYAGAALFLYPSRYEGFGLPVLEAMQSGVPVICTADTSMAEITGDSALLVNAGDSATLRELLLQTLSDEPLRQRLASEGLKRAQVFSWQRCAEQTLGVYQSVS